MLSLMTTRLRWGILGTGNIARQFVEGLATSRRCSVVAVASRTPETANRFGASHDIPAAHRNYDELLRDDRVDAIYNALPNSMHLEWTVKAIQAGKHVLCEKPLAVNASQAEEMFDEADRAERLLAEAFMYRSHPLTHAVADALRRGVIGRLKLIRTSFCYRTTRIAGNIRFDRALAGGALMDIGCYCVNFSRFFAGAEPTAIHGVGTLHSSGVDEFAAGTLTFPSGVVATFACGMGLQADNTATLCGTEGFIEIPIPWKPPMERAMWILGRGAPPRMDNSSLPTTPPPKQTLYVDAPASLYALEADDFAASALDGAPHPLSRADSIGNMKVLDELRRQIGVSFD